MKNKILYLAAIIFFLSSYSYAEQRSIDVPTAVVSQQKSTEQMTIDTIKKVTQATVTVETKRFLGTGFFISNDTVLTCYHLFKEEGIENVTVKIGDRAVWANVVKVDKESDLALIHVEIYHNNIVPLKIADKVDIGQTVLTTGFPLGNNLYTSKGMLSQINQFISIDIKDTPHTFNVVNMDINEGNSGGALYDIDGNVVGVIHAESTVLKGYGYTTSLDDIKKFIGNGL